MTKLPGSVTVGGIYYTDEIFLSISLAMPDDPSFGYALQISCHEGAEESTECSLDLTGVRKLRLALQRYEQELKRLNANAIKAN